MPGLGSVTEGMVGTQLDLQNIQMNQFKLQEAPIKLQQEQVDLAKDTLALNQQMTMLKLMQGIKVGEHGDTPDQMSDILNQMSMIQLQSGMPDAAAKTASEAAKLQNTASQIDYRTYKVQTDRFSKFANILDGVPDSQQGFAMAVQAMGAADPRAMQDPKFQEIIKQGWKPGLIPMLKRSVLTAKEQAEVKYRQQAGEHAEASATLDKARIGLVKAQEKLATDRDKAIQKEGGKPPTADDRKAIIEQINRDYTGADQADVYARARPLAEQMKKLIRDEHLTQSEAAVRVYEQARASGAFAGLRQTRNIPGTRPGLPLTVPKGASVKDLQQNMWYMYKGKPVLVIGTKGYTEEELAAMDDDEKEALGLDEDSDENSDEDNEEAKE